ncbi:hypothetical protein TCAL_16451 [Tigriopus californicus]|uniref:Chitin-binding type-2 domain-containing protein n=1 Tax=Tigriopus californicus TaxID=6832 RepID=A0A553NY79_TIGCA|nr:serum response factor homolog A-like [Tigriopus californicus]TRY70395.1 hypothetical protein TCAL_16451 [Tigriopus californicus]
MNPMFAVLALALTVVSGQRGRASNGYGAPPAAAPQPQYNQQPLAQEPQAQYGQQAQASSLSESQHGGDHQGLDWLLESVPGQPGTDYPIYADASQFDFDCNGQTQGYYADPAAQCQAFHVCLETDQPGVLRAESFLCPNGTIFNQEYLICDWWFNFDCSQAQSLYSVNDQIEAERQQATKSQANNNNNNNYTPSNGNNNNNFNNNNNNNFGSASNNNNNYASPAQATYGGK